MTPQLASSTGLAQSGQSGVLNSQPSTQRSIIGLESSIVSVWFPVPSQVSHESFLYLYSRYGLEPAMMVTSTC